MESEAELSVCDADLGADFITVELDTQPIEYVVKWAEVGSKFTISCLKTDQSELGDGLRRDDSESELTDTLRVDQSQVDPDSFLAPYEEVYCDPCEIEAHSVEVRTDWDSAPESDSEPDAEVVLESSQPDSDQDADRDQDRYRCSYCGKTYSHASSLYRHQQSHTGKPPPPPGRRQHHDQRHTCPHCGLSFKGSRMLGSHLRLHGKRRIHPCNICGKEFNHSSSLSRHRLIHKKGKGPSKDPGDASGALPNMVALQALKPSPRKHRNKRSASTSALHKLFACPQCDMSFRTSTQLSKHQVTHVKALLGGFPGKDKENVVETPDLKIRLKLCSGDKPNVYALCARRRRRAEPNSEPSDAEEEEEEEEEEPGEGRRHRCSQCGKYFSHASSLTRHLHTHLKTHLSPAPQRRGNKTYTCLTCHKTFLHSSSFSRHKRAHREQQQRLEETAPIESESE